MIPFPCREGRGAPPLPKPYGLTPRRQVAKKNPLSHRDVQVSRAPRGSVLSGGQDDLQMVRVRGSGILASAPPTNASSRRRPRSRTSTKKSWTPAFAGVTKKV